MLAERGQNCTLRNSSKLGMAHCPERIAFAKTAGPVTAVVYKQPG
jgi:hypothetical protein